MVTLLNIFYIFSGKIKLLIVEQIIRDAIEYDSYSTGEVILPPGHEALPPGQKPLSPSRKLGRSLGRRQKDINSLVMGVCS